MTAAVVTYDRAAKKNVLVKDQIMTIHYNAQNVPQDKRDAAWKAYVDLYRANSEIVQEDDGLHAEKRMIAGPPAWV